MLSLNLCQMEPCAISKASTILVRVDDDEPMKRYIAECLGTAFLLADRRVGIMGDSLSDGNIGIALLAIRWQRVPFICSYFDVWINVGCAL